MALTEAQMALVEAFQKASDDKVIAIIKDVFLMKQVEIEAIVGDNVIALPDEPYDDAEYVINIYSAMDYTGIDVKGELKINPGRTVSGFTINALTPCKIKIITHRKVPKITFWT